jgi:integrase
MVERRQLPPQIKRVELTQRDGGRAVIRYQLTVDVGVVDGKRKQRRKRYATEREARAVLDAVRGDAGAWRNTMRRVATWSLTRLAWL